MWLSSMAEGVSEWLLASFLGNSQVFMWLGGVLGQVARFPKAASSVGLIGGGSTKAESQVLNFRIPAEWLEKEALFWQEQSRSDAS